MKKKLRTGLSMIALFAIISQSNAQENNQEIMQNPLLKEWQGPYEGVPAFDKMEVSLIKPAIRKGMELHLEEIDQIANNTAEATFENTIIPMEKAGKELDRAFTYYGIYSSNISSPEFRAVQKELAPEISEYSSKISQNEALFERIKTVYENSQKKPLDSAEQRVIDLVYEEFAMQGADLSEEDKKRYAEINKELSALYTKFSSNVLADEENYVIYLTKEQTGGLPESYVKSAAKAAEDRDHKGYYAVTNTRSSMDPFLTYSTERELREKAWKNYYSRGDNNDEFDNKETIQKILKLRDERVELLGFDNYAQWRLQNRMAKNPENAMDLMMQVWPAALARVKEEVADMQKVADSENANITIKPWDYRFYAEKVRKEKYDLDSEEVKQYLELGNLTQALFFTAGELFNFAFTPVENNSVPVFHEDVNVWEVSDKDSGEIVGLWYLDPYARQGKRSGAWATTYRGYTKLTGEKPVLASNNSNFIEPAPGEPVLVSWDGRNIFP